MRLGASLRTPLVALLLMLTACPDPGIGEPDSEVTGPSGGGGDDASSSTSGATSAAVTTDPSTSTSHGESTGDPSSTSSGDTDTSTSTSTSGASDTDDTGDTTDTEPPEPPKCRTVDLLFVLDNSEHMPEAWGPLDKLGDHLVARLNGDLSGWDYHIMVIDADAEWGIPACEARCDQGEDCEDISPGYPCDYNPGKCDVTLGAGIRAHAGLDAANKDCGIADGRRYITDAQPNMHSTLKCLLDIGVGGGFGMRLMQAIGNATGKTLNAPGGCNEGFMRDEAFLVTMIVNTMPDNNSPGTPAYWHEQVLATKKGNFDKVFMIGMINDAWWDNICGLWTLSGNIQMIEDFVSYFFRREISSLCVDDYRPSLDKALDYVETACQGKP